jgi:glycosyltransferase involved in cell wall biosynthesis
MDVLVHASLREGLARALPQALLAGKPVVTYDIDGAREVAITGQTGFLVPPRAEALIEPLVALSRDAALRGQLGRAGRDLCLPRFGHECMTRRIRDLYEAVLSRQL